MNRALPVVQWPRSALEVEENAALGDALTADAANEMSGTLSYAAGATHPASLTDDLGSGRTTAFTMAAGSSVFVPRTPSADLTDDALNEENETFTIIDNDPPAAPGGLAVAAGDEQLTASWTKPDGPVTGYQARWKETAATD